MESRKDVLEYESKFKFIAPHYSSIRYLTFSDTGYVKGSLFLNFITQCFLPQLQQKRAYLKKNDLLLVY